MSGALRFNEGKPSLAYILQFANPIKAVARIMEFGAMKYADGNWRKGGKPDKEYLDSMMRHLTLWIHGEVYDDDSGCSHLGHAIWNLMALHELNHPDEIIDDEVFKRQCAYWKDKKEEEPDTTDYANMTPEEYRKNRDAIKQRIGAEKEESAMIPAASRSEEREVQETPPKCPECGSPTNRFRATWECDCGWWGYHADSGLTRNTSGGEEQKEEEETEPQDNDSVDPDFIFDKQTCESFEASLRDIVFGGLTGLPNVAKHSTKKKKKVKRKTTPSRKGKVE